MNTSHFELLMEIFEENMTDEGEGGLDMEKVCGALSYFKTNIIDKYNQLVSRSLLRGS